MCAIGIPEGNSLSGCSIAELKDYCTMKTRYLKHAKKQNHSTDLSIQSHQKKKKPDFSRKIIYYP
jgi:hypothetical protein